MTRLRLAVVSDALYPWHKGGKETRYRYLLRELPRHDLDVEVFSMRWWDEDPAAEETECGSLSFTAICPRIPLYHGDRRSIYQSFRFALATFRLLYRRFDVLEADHMPYLQLAPLRLVALVKRVPLVVTWHEVWGREGWRKYLGRLGFVGAMAESFGIRLPNEIVAVSEGTGQRLVAMGARSTNVTVIPNALDVEYLNSVEPDPAAPDLLFVGRLLKHKNPDQAVEATRLLRERGYKVRLGIVGVGPEEDSLREQVRRGGLDDAVDFLGTFDDHKAVWAIMRGSRVLLAPSTREGYGLVVAEALALGTPAVCVRHPDNESARLIGPDTGSLVEPGDPAALADAAEGWLSDMSPRAARARQFVLDHAELSPESMGQSYAQLFRATVAVRRRVQP